MFLPKIAEQSPRTEIQVTPLEVNKSQKPVQNTHIQLCLAAPQTSPTPTELV